MRVCGGWGGEVEEKGGMHWARGAETFAHPAVSEGEREDEQQRSAVAPVIIIIIFFLIFQKH